jgi:hypothetical protein
VREANRSPRCGSASISRTSTSPSIMDTSRAGQPQPNGSDGPLYYGRVVDFHLRSLPEPKARVFWPIGMEQLWNRGGATGCKGSARQRTQKGLL